MHCSLLLSPLQIAFDGCTNVPYLMYNGEQYNLLQLHIHSPSEYTVRGDVQYCGSRTRVGSLHLCLAEQMAQAQHSRKSEGAFLCRAFVGVAQPNVCCSVTIVVAVLRLIYSAV